MNALLSGIIHFAHRLARHFVCTTIWTMPIFAVRLDKANVGIIYLVIGSELKLMSAFIAFVVHIVLRLLMKADDDYAFAKAGSI